MFLNISSDKVCIWTWTENIFLDRDWIENVLWSELVKIYKKYKDKEIVVLNWPWWFTNLRVWTLCVNLLNELENSKIKIYDISKIQLYQYLFKKNLIPQYWIIYIWQRKNIRIYDFSQDKYKTETIENININIKENYFLDQVSEDWYYWKLDKKLMLNILFQKDHIQIKYNSQKTELSLKELKLKALKQIKPNYMIDPKTS